MRSGDNDPLGNSRVRMQTPSVAKKSAAKPDLPPLHVPVRRMWRFATRVLHVAVKLRLLFMRCQTLTKSKMLLLSRHRVFLVVLFFASCSCQRQRQQCRTQWHIGNLRRSERISSRAQSVEPSALGVQLKQRGRSAARSGASSGASSRLTTQPTPGGFASKHRRSSLASPEPSAEQSRVVYQRRFARTRRSLGVQTS